jgi:hypothetical protein
MVNVGVKIAAVVTLAVIAVSYVASTLITPPSQAQLELVTLQDINPGPGWFHYVAHRVTGNSRFENQTDAAWCQFDNHTTSIECVVRIFKSNTDCKAVINSMRGDEDDAFISAEVRLGDGGFIFNLSYWCYIVFTTNRTLVEINIQYIDGHSDLRIGLEAMRIAEVQLHRMQTN